MILSQVSISESYQDNMGEGGGGGGARGENERLCAVPFTMGKITTSRSRTWNS